MHKLHPLLATFFFVVVFIVLYQIPETFDLGPFSLHKWRQSDSASIAMAYFHNGIHFFEPKVMNVLGGDGAAVGEFPIYYYLSAALYHVFGPSDGIIRLLHWLTLVAGVFFFLKVVDKEIGAFAVYATSFFLSSIGLFAFYGFNFLPDIPAFGWLLIGAYALYNSADSKRLFWLGIAAICLAGLLKPTILIPFFAWWGIWLVFFLFKKEKLASFPATTKMILGLCIVLIVNAAWIFWAKQYNASHDSGIFLGAVMPIWDLDANEIQYTWDLLWDSYLHRIVRRPALWLLVGFLLLSMVSWKKFTLIWCVFSSFVLMGTVVYFFLFFQQFRIHDYYLIACLWLFVVVLLGGIYLIQTQTRGYVKYFLQFLLLFILSANINMSYYYVKGNYAPDSVYQKEVPECMLDRNSTRQFIEKAGLTYKENLVGVHPDPSPNIALYNLNLKGFNLAPDFKPKFIPQLEALGVDHFISSDTAFIRQANKEGFLGEPVDSLDQCLWIFQFPKN
jgi:hypothetical protein